MLSERPWRLELVLPFGLGLFAMSFGVGPLLMAWLTSKYAPITIRPEYVTIVVGTLCFHGAAFVLIMRLLREHEFTFANAFGFSRSRAGRSALLGMTGALLAMPFILGLGYLWGHLLSLCHVRTELQQPVQMLQGSAPLPLRILIGVIAILIAPVAEEMVFRGILYPTLKRHGFRRAALWGTAFLFAAVHLNLVTFVPLVVLALVLAWLYEATDNLLAPIVGHSFFNLVNFFLVSPLFFD